MKTNLAISIYDDLHYNSGYLIIVVRENFEVVEVLDSRGRIDDFRRRYYTSLEAYDFDHFMCIL